jgi:hypothetical protein
MNLKFKIGDLIGIKSSNEDKLIKNCPPGIIIDLDCGYPLSPEKYLNPRSVATILWNDGIEQRVDLEWLLKID